MPRPLLVRGARQLLTLRGPVFPRRGAACLELGIINDGSVLIRNGRIVSVGPSRRVDNLSEARNAGVLEAHGAVVLPAFVDAWLPVPDVSAVAIRALRLAFTHGSSVVCAGGSSHALRTLAVSELTTPLLVPSLNLYPGYDELQVLRTLRRNLAEFVRIDPLLHSLEALRAIRSLGPALRLYCDSLGGTDWIGLALAYGASVLDIQRPPTAAQIALLADASAVAVLTPASAGAARSLVDGHAAVALGSGFSDIGISTCSMQVAALSAVRDGGLDPAEAITLSTINGAHALGVASACGSIEVGKQANLLVLHLSDYRDIVNFMGVNLVSKIVQAGTLVS